MTKALTSRMAKNRRNLEIADIGEVKSFTEVLLICFAMKERLPIPLCEAEIKPQIAQTL